MQFDEHQISGKGQTKNGGNNCDDIDDETRRLKISRVDLFAGAPVTNQSRETNQHSRYDRRRAKPNRKPGGRHNMPLALQLHPLPYGDGKTANRKTKYDDGDASAHPSEKRALVREMISR